MYRDHQKGIVTELEISFRNSTVTVRVWRSPSRGRGGHAFLCIRGTCIKLGGGMIFLPLLFISLNIGRKLCTIAE